MEKVAVFIDGSNLYFAVKDGLKRQDIVDIEKLSHKLVGSRELVRIYYYNAPPPPQEDPEVSRTQQAFRDRLGYINYLQRRDGRLVPRMFRFKCPECQNVIEYKRHIQKGVDTRLAVDLVVMAVTGHYDVGILISGDKDFVEAVNFVKEHTHKRIENAFVLWRGWDKELREAADVRTILTEEFLSDCWVEKRK
jgi:uncharacterized LabA/DUF88 family protein